MKEEKKIQDYLHLYLGCEVGIQNSGNVFQKYTLSGLRPKFDEQKKKEVLQLLLTPIQDDNDILNEPLCSFWEWPHKCNLFIRPLSDMNEEEATNVYTIERDRTLHPPTNDHDIRRGDGSWKIVRLDLIDTTLFITDNAIVYKVTEDKGKPMIEFVRNPPEIFQYLLSRGFDLFGLIESGIAIDKTKLS